MNNLQEVLEEKDQLSERLVKLRTFLDSGTTIDEQSRSLLVQQGAVMATYFSILEERIRYFVD